MNGGNGEFYLFLETEGKSVAIFSNDKNQHKEAVYGYEINNKMYNALEQKLYNT